MPRLAGEAAPKLGPLGQKLGSLGFGEQDRFLRVAGPNLVVRSMESLARGLLEQVSFRFRARCLRFRSPMVVIYYGGKDMARTAPKRRAAVATSGVIGATEEGLGWRAPEMRRGLARRCGGFTRRSHGQTSACSEDGSGYAGGG